MSTAFFWQKRGFAGAIDEQRAKMVNRLVALCRENKKPVPPSFASVAQRQVPLFDLFRVVIERGGYAHINAQHMWHHVALALDLWPAVDCNATALLFELRTQYADCSLLDLEVHMFHSRRSMVGFGSVGSGPILLPWNVLNADGSWVISELSASSTAATQETSRRPPKRRAQSSNPDEAADEDAPTDAESRAHTPAPAESTAVDINVPATAPETAPTALAPPLDSNAPRPAAPSDALQIRNLFPCEDLIRVMPTIFGEGNAAVAACAAVPENSRKREAHAGPHVFRTPEGHSVYSRAGLAYISQSLRSATGRNWALNTLLLASASRHDEILFENCPDLLPMLCRASGSRNSVSVAVDNLIQNADATPCLDWSAMLDMNSPDIDAIRVAVFTILRNLLAVPANCATIAKSISHEESAISISQSQSVIDSLILGLENSSQQISSLSFDAAMHLSQMASSIPDPLSHAVLSFLKRSLLMFTSFGLVPLDRPSQSNTDSDSNRIAEADSGDAFDAKLRALARIPTPASMPRASPSALSLSSAAAVATLALKGIAALAQKHRAFLLHPTSVDMWTSVIDCLRVAAAGLTPADAAVRGKVRLAALELLCYVATLPEFSEYLSRSSFRLVELLITALRPAPSTDRGWPSLGASDSQPGMTSVCSRSAAAALRHLYECPAMRSTFDVHWPAIFEAASADVDAALYLAPLLLVQQ